MPNESEYLDLWRSGVPLSEAQYRYIPKPDPQQSVEAENRRATLRSFVPNEELRKGVDAVLELQLQNEAITAGRQTILDGVENRTLLAIGFSLAEPAQANAVPHAIFQKDFVKWDKSRIVGPGIQFEKVRIVRLHSETTMESVANSTPAFKLLAAKEISEPSRGYYHHAKSVIEALLERDPLWWRLSAERALPEFNAEFARQHPHHSVAKTGITSRALRKYKRIYEVDGKVSERSGT